MRARKPHKTRRTRGLRIAIAEQHVLTADSLFAVISHSRPDCELVGHAANATQAVALCCQLRPDVLLIDSGLSGSSGVRATAEVKRAAPKTRVLIYCSTANPDIVLQALQAGADGFVEKTCSRSEFVEAVDHVANGEKYLCRTSMNHLVLAVCSMGQAMHDGTDLTPREREVLALIAGGETSKQIARKLFIGVSTVETHRANLMAKVRVRNVAQLVQYGFQHGLLSDDR